MVEYHDDISFHGLEELNKVPGTITAMFAAHAFPVGPLPSNFPATV
jgi:hypothetical protein